MASLEAFDKDVKELVNSNKLSSSRIKAVTDAAMANIASDAHIVATLFKVHKQAKSTHKISSLYVIDAIAREARQQAKKAAQGKQSSSNNNTPLQDGTPSGVNDDSDDLSSEKRRIVAKGTYASFLSKIEVFLDRLVTEVLTKGPPEHKDKVKKVLDIWKKSSTFSSDALKPCYAKLSGEVLEADAKTKKPRTKHSEFKTEASGQGSTTPPYPPPERPIIFPQYTTAAPAAPSGPSSNPNHPSHLSTDISSQSTNLAALLGSITASSLLVPPPAAAEPASQPIPGFESSQLALLQQLAAQTGTSAPFSTSSTSTHSVIPTSLSNATNEAGAPVPSSSNLISEHPSQSSRNNWSTAPVNNGFSRERSPRESTRRQSRWDSHAVTQSGRDAERRRSISPERARNQPPRRRSPARGSSPPSKDRRRDNWASEAEDVRPPRGNRRQQQETRQIATFISDDRREDRPGAKGKDNRYAFESDDFSSFEVQTNNNLPQGNQEGDAFSSQQWNTAQHNPEGADLMSNAAPFNPVAFNALEPESWASFAMMCQGNIGRLPTTMEMMQWIMSSMAMMQASVGQMNGAEGGMMAPQGMYGMMQGMGDANNMFDMQQISQQVKEPEHLSQSNANGIQATSRTWGQQQEIRGREQPRDSSIEPDTRPPPPTRDDGEGEAEMEMTPEPET